jgi:hypothetical protein
VTLSRLDERSRDQVWAAWTAVETALAPVPARDYAALRDPALRVHIERLSTDAGRVLFETEDGWLTGYDDSVASRLAAEGFGILDENDRAVLALVLINTICLHRSQKGVSRQAGWDAPGVSSEELLRYRPQYRSVMRASLRRLEAATIIARSPTAGIVPGPALRRLTPKQSQRLWEDLLVAADPNSPIADAIRSRRTQEDQ